jgi:hypothetical protein
MSTYRTHTYRQDAAYELAGIEQRLVTNERSAETTANRKSAAIADAVRPSLERRAVELRALVATLPERPTASGYRSSTTGWPLPVVLGEVDLSQFEEIPDFLKRTR